MFTFLLSGRRAKNHSWRQIRSFIFWVTVLVCLPTLMLAWSSAAAAGPSDAIVKGANAAQAREQQRQEARQRTLRAKQEATPDVRLDSTLVVEGLTAIPAQESPCFAITRIELTGETAERFQWALNSAFQAGDPAPTPSRCLGVAGVNLVMKRIQDAILAKGFITTRVIAGKQDLSGGVLSLTLVAGRVRGIRFADGTSPKASWRSALPIRSGQILNLRNIEQGLENFKRLPTAEANLNIVPAQDADAQAGESDLVIAWAQGRPVRFGLGLDDAGTKSSGQYQGSANISWDHPLALNDQFFVGITHDIGGAQAIGGGSNGWTTTYSVPWGGKWQMSVLGSSSNYHQTVGLAQNYTYSGRSRNADVKLTRMLYRDGARKLGGYGRLWWRDSKNFIDDTEVQIQRRRMAGWELGLTHREYWGASTLDAALAYRRGTGAFGSLVAPEEVFDEGSSRPQIITLDASIRRPFALGSKRLTYLGTVRTQWNKTSLVPQDRLSIGGRYTVRGFDGESQLAADRGWLIRNELSIALRNRIEAYAGFDHGQVSGQSALILAGTKLTGMVLGVRGAIEGPGEQSWIYDAFIGRPISQPEGFLKESAVAGFQVNWNY